MQQEFSKIWVLEQLTKLNDTLKQDLDKIERKLEGLVSHQICDERRNQDINERVRVEKRLDDIDGDMDKIKDSFDESLNQIRMWAWGILGAVIGELIMVIMNITLNK